MTLPPDAPNPVYKKAQRGRRGRPAARPLREIRLGRGLTLQALQLASGVPLATISQIERGRLVAHPDEADRIAVALGFEAGSMVTRALLVHEASA